MRALPQVSAATAGSEPVNKSVAMVAYTQAADLRPKLSPSPRMASPAELSSLSHVVEAADKELVGARCRDANFVTLPRPWRECVQGKAHARLFIFKRLFNISS
jgi:hypothetical protein